jgi:prolyl oligopeptidase
MVLAHVADPYLWLEDVEGEDALAWVRERNERTKRELASGDAFETLRRDLLTIFDSNERIPYVTKRGAHLYNFWQDAANPRGLWRRTTLGSYRKSEPEWDVLLDIDELNRIEDENWVWRGASYLEPAEGEPYRHVLVALSRGGSDADVTREFDLETRSFVSDGFFRPEAKGGLSWIDRDTVYVFTDFGEGTMTRSGYPRIVKQWRRGTSLAEATTVYEGEADDIYIAAGHDQTKGFERDFVQRTIAFYDDELYLRDGDGLTKIDVPNSAQKYAHREWLVVELREPWEDHAAGSLLVTRFDDFMDGERSFDVLFTPDEHSSLVAASWTRHHVLLNVMRDVKNEVFVLTPSDGGWTREPLRGAPSIGTVVAGGMDADRTDEYFMQTTDFLKPDTLWIGTVGEEPEPVKSLPAFFDATGSAATQHFATSADGTKIPYFVVGPKSEDGPRPTLLTGYGGFEIPLLPAYLAQAGRAWIEGGGVFVEANIRGGGEYGPRWHQAALRENRKKAFEDFAAVARDLIARGVTTAKQLGCMGGSNGGLLVGNMLTTYPELFGAIVCQVPLLDMQRYNKLLAGASWVAEYGDPDEPGDWAFLQAFSPYHNVRGDASYPPVLFITSTRDDRVHPGHARKMMARMEEQGHDVRYYENVEGGHGAAADNAQRAFMGALEYTFLKDKLGLDSH